MALIARKSSAAPCPVELSPGPRELRVSGPPLPTPSGGRVQRLRLAVLSAQGCPWLWGFQGDAARAVPVLCWRGTRSSSLTPRNNPLRTSTESRAQSGRCAPVAVETEAGAPCAVGVREGLHGAPGALPRRKLQVCSRGLRRGPEQMPE